jgi:hypothetical protein
MEGQPSPTRPGERLCLRCGSPAMYFHATAEVWRDCGIVRWVDGAIVPLIPGREVPLCPECAGLFDPRSVVRWNAPAWVVPA